MPFNELVNVYLTKDQKKLIEKHAEEEKRSLSNFVSHATFEYIKQKNNGAQQ